MDRALHLASRIERRLAPHANLARSRFMTGGYAPSALHCLGVTVPELRVVVREWSAALKLLPPRAVIATALALTDRGTVEGRQVGYELIARRRDAMALLTTTLVERLGKGNDNWASVDGFATTIAGPAWREGRVTDVAVRRWARSPNKWWRRTALAATVALNIAARGGTGDAVRTLMVCDLFSEQADPMLAKALSWALRSMVQHDPSAVRAFLARHQHLPALVRREVTTKLETGRKTKCQGA